MTRKAIFYHAGCPICVDAERQFAGKLDPKQYEVELVHLDQAKNRVAGAEGGRQIRSGPSASTVRPVSSILGPIALK